MFKRKARRRVNKMEIKLDKQSEEDLQRTRQGYGVIFINVAENDVRSTEFWLSSDMSFRTATFKPSEDLHKWIEDQLRKSQEKGGE